ncbi:hypothetical protein L207DRAFT_511661 [Hyaloscypha variabilis F]|uniref:Aminoglycoside phosphotransferase domain-containing protein n=1 Tax=Hyaloscypha variabilis (strain UAMH 11265 / GT02V1 / F) TaxID=1149755 RepID=A0A2J6RTX7_HYAVF|nr:hypothetical protein L207DRAFT_511661 [Hyaloscypha variabilis F]
MAQLQQAENDAMPVQILQQLSQTPYACTSVTQQSTRPGNFVYRGVLAQPLTLQNGGRASSIIIKHSTDLAATYRDSPLDIKRCIFEESLFNSVADFSPPTTTTTVIKAPRLHLYNRQTSSSTQVLEDFSNTTGFKAMLFSPNADSLLPQSSRTTIGRNLGSWLRSFHTWASAPERAALRAQLPQDDPMRKLKRLLTYDGFLRALENYPELLEGHKETLETIRDVMIKEFEKLPTEGDENLGLIHGDFWSGNILIPSTGWREPPPSDGTNELFIIDWEFAQFGHRCYDLGQIVGDLCERKVYNKIDTGLAVMEGVIDGYGELSDYMAFRTAIHVGVHLVGYYNRRPQRGPWVASPEAIVAGMTAGRDFIIKGWEKDRKFFEGSLLASLFTAK